jgi:hypothetical protein
MGAAQPGSFHKRGLSQAGQDAQLSYISPQLRRAVASFGF